jgi:hypothetical protein
MIPKNDNVELSFDTEFAGKIHEAGFQNIVQKVAAGKHSIVAERIRIGASPCELDRKYELFEAL